MIALVMGFLPMDQMVLESKRIIRLDSEFIFRPAAAEIVVNMGDVMVNDHDHSSDLVCLCSFPKTPASLETDAASKSLPLRDYGCWVS